MIFKTKKSETEHKIPFSKMIKKKVVVAIEIFSKHVPKIVLSVSGGGFWQDLEIDEKEVTQGNFKKIAFFEMKKKRHTRLRLVKVENVWFFTSDLIW